jgi:hypothetical protein
MRYIDQLILDCEQAKNAVPTQEQEFELNDLSEFELNNLSELDKISNAIYVVEEIGGDIEITFTDLSRYKSLKERRCPKLNEPSAVMYVGSSTTGLRKRIEQHIGEGHKDTYALHLKHWFSGKCRIKIMQYAEPRNVLQIIEDDISDSLKPAFGKKGANNK